MSAVDSQLFFVRVTFRSVVGLSLATVLIIDVAAANKHVLVTHVEVG